MRHPVPGGVFYADPVSSSDDPLYIVPAVLPDDESAASTTRGTPSTAGASGTTTVTANVIKVEDKSSASGANRVVRFERQNVLRRTRVVRHIDPLSVFRVALAAHFVLYLVLLLAGVLLWNVANATGTIDNIERFLESFGWESFQFNGGELFHQAWTLGLFAVVGLTGLAVLLATTFNLITDLVGGVRVTVVETRTRPRPEPAPRIKKTTKK